jgi:hypothetical protein
MILITILVVATMGVQHRHTPHNIIEHTHAKILVSALERQVSYEVTLLLNLLIIGVT